MNICNSARPDENLNLIVIPNPRLPRVRDLLFVSIEVKAPAPQHHPESKERTSEGGRYKSHMQIGRVC